MLRTIKPFIASTLFCVACSQYVDTGKTLQQATQLTQAQDDTKLASLDADCRLSDAGCGKLRRLKAEACQRLSEAEGLTAKQRRRALDCATGNYNAALAVWDRTRETSARPDDIAPVLLRLLAQRRDVEGAVDKAQDLNRRLGFRAEALAHERGAAGQAGLVWQADAAAYAAMAAGPDEACAGLAHAVRLLERATPQGTAVEGKAAELTIAIQRARTARDCQ